MSELTKIEETLKQLPTAYTPSNHIFTQGLYTRETFLPQGTSAIGKRHRHSTLNILTKGTMTVALDDDINHSVTLEAPCAFESKAGAKKLVHCHTDCIILNVHRTDSTDLEILENELTVEDIEADKAWYTSKEEPTCHG